MQFNFPGEQWCMESNTISEILTPSPKAPKDWKWLPKHQSQETTLQRNFPHIQSDKDSYMSLCLLQLQPVFQTIKILFKLYIRNSHNIWLKGVWILYSLPSSYRQVGHLNILVIGRSRTSVLQNNTNSAHCMVLKPASGSLLSCFSPLWMPVNITLVGSMPI